MDALVIPTLETERLRLRPFRKSDLDDYAALNADPEVLRYLGCGPVPWDRGRSSRHMAFLLGHWQIWGSGTWAVEQRETGALVGRVGFSEPEGWPGFELAWTLARRYWGQGYATEGARAALDHAFSILKRERVISLIYPKNHASIRVAERLGESLQGRIDLHGREMLCYGIERETHLAQLAPLGECRTGAGRCPEMASELHNMHEEPGNMRGGRLAGSGRVSEMAGGVSAGTGGSTEMLGGLLAETGG